jgi:hypothetical protein
MACSRSRWFCASLLAASAIVGGCGAEDLLLAPPPPDRVVLQGTLALPATVWAQNPRAELHGDEAHCYALPGAPGDMVTARLSAASCAQMDAVLFLLAADGSLLARSSPEPGTPCSSDAVLHAAHPGPGAFFVVAAATEPADGRESR